MNKYFNYYNSLCVGANTPTIFSYDPYITAIKSMLVNELRQVVYYIIKLKDYDFDMTQYRDKVIDFISTLIVNLDFKRESFFVIIEDLYNNKIKLKNMYIDSCKLNNTEPELLTLHSIDLSSKEAVLKLLNEHEKNIDSFEKKVPESKKILYRFAMSIVLNACNALIELKNCGIDMNEAKDEVLKLINNSNYTFDDDKNIAERIKEFARCNYKIMTRLYAVTEDKFGPVEPSVINLSLKKGKAVLVSGSDLSDLENILNTVKDKSINVYTHHDAIGAFKYQKIKSHHELAGHCQLYKNDFRLEFASFPGPVYISGNSLPKIDVIRGRIYTSAKYPELGIGKIENGDFSPLVTAALESDGFPEDIIKSEIKTGYSCTEITEKAEYIAKLLKDREIKHIFIIGSADMFGEENKYIRKFLKESKEDFYVISFAYDSDKKNFWHANNYYDFSMLYKLIEKLSEKIPDLSENVSIFLSDCDVSTLSHMFNLMYLNIKKLFLGPCCPDIINPLMMKGLKDVFGINSLTCPSKDIKIALKKEED